MSSRAAPRVLVLAAVVAVHAGALLVLLAETRTRHLGGESETSPLIVMLLEASAHPPPAAPAGRAARPSASRHRPAAAAAEVEVPAAPVPTTAGSAIDWAAEATAAAAREIEGAERRARQARALAPKPSSMFAARPKRHEFRWDPASTRRVEPVPGLGTIIHLSDECVIFVFVIIPIAGGCALEKAPARGDLFEHMHDPDPGPEP
jgi:hypothetical protein